MLPDRSRNWTPSSCSTSWQRQTTCEWMLSSSLEVRQCGTKFRCSAVTLATASKQQLASAYNTAVDAEKLGCSAADIQLLNNHTCLHTRGAFIDFQVRPHE